MPQDAEPYATGRKAADVTNLVAPAIRIRLSSYGEPPDLRYRRVHRPDYEESIVFLESRRGSSPAGVPTAASRSTRAPRAP